MIVGRQLRAEGFFNIPYVPNNPSLLQRRFVVPPFSVLDAKAGYWQDRKRAWLALGIESELGRASEGEVKRFTFVPGTKDYADLDPVSKKILDTGSGTSIFDPVLCECVYSWFCPENGCVLDPFAGGSVRGIVAGHMGRNYVGVDLREGQIRANVIQRENILKDLANTVTVKWIHGDSKEILHVPDDCIYDLVFTCPPYADLERYSDDPRDLSTMEYKMFRDAYREIISYSAKLLKMNRFAVFVVGEARNKGGNYYGLVPDTIRAFRNAGMSYYNEAVFLTAIGSLPLRVTNQFRRSRKFGRTHQNVLVFVKGDPKIATAACNRRILVKR